jgi:hypothetical protein
MSASAVKLLLVEDSLSDAGLLQESNLPDHGSAESPAPPAVDD